jgi:hypothetical protein
MKTLAPGATGRAASTGPASAEQKGSPSTGPPDRLIKLKVFFTDHLKVGVTAGHRLTKLYDGEIVHVGKMSMLTEREAKRIMDALPRGPRNPPTNGPQRAIEPPEEPVRISAPSRGRRVKTGAGLFD